jgi:hypothetical protein
MKADVSTSRSRWNGRKLTKKRRVVRRDVKRQVLFVQGGG